MARWHRMTMRARRELDPSSTDDGPFVCHRGNDDGNIRIYESGAGWPHGPSISVNPWELRRLAVQLMFYADEYRRRNDDPFEELP